MSDLVVNREFNSNKEGRMCFDNRYDLYVEIAGSGIQISDNRTIMIVRKISSYSRKGFYIAEWCGKWASVNNCVKSINILGRFIDGGKIIFKRLYGICGAVEFSLEDCEIGNPGRKRLTMVYNFYTKKVKKVVDTIGRNVNNY